jgi:hypothetical protein
MAKIVWLASYPKSGNTWLRFMLANLIYGKPVTSSNEVKALVPDIHDGVPGLQLYGDRTTIIKTHWAYYSALPLREDVVGVVHLVRNPVEVMESNQNYAMTRSGDLYKKTSEAKREQLAAEFVDAFIKNGGHARFRDFGIGSWEEHTLSWTSKTNAMPRCGVRYEDLVADPAAQLRRVCGFLKLRKSDGDIAAAIAASTKAEMARIEGSEIAGREEGLFYQKKNSPAYDSGHRFVSRSSDGTTRYRISEEQRLKALQRFGPLMKKLGYPTA